jgi:hypothetical protein
MGEMTAEEWLEAFDHFFEYGEQDIPTMWLFGNAGTLRNVAAHFDVELPTLEVGQPLLDAVVAIYGAAKTWITKKREDDDAE